jgi:ribosomal protein S18 acetylase RimI-like enzyme
MNTLTITIRRAGTDECETIVPMMIDFNAAEGIAWQPSTMVPALRHLLASPELGFVAVAYDAASGEALGYGLASFGYDVEFSGKDAFIAELFVRKEQRGKHVGQALLDYVVRELSQDGTKAVHLMVRPENTRARSIYEATGFQVVPRLLMTKKT